MTMTLGDWLWVGLIFFSGCITGGYYVLWRLRKYLPNPIIERTLELSFEE